MKDLSLEKKTKTQLKKMADIIIALTTVYGPINIDDLVDKIAFYFPKEYESFYTADICGTINALVKTEMISITKDELVSMYHEKEVEKMLKDEQLSGFYYSSLEKVFDNPKDILNYIDIFDMKNNKAFDELKDFIMNLNCQENVDRNDLFKQAVAIEYVMSDEEKFMDLLEKETGEEIDREKLQELMMEFGGTLPRGILHGYSFKELGEKIDDIGSFIEFERNRLEKPARPKKFGSYSYVKCVELAKKLKDTGIFEKFCSDNLLELYINNKEIFVQLLGYYNSDRNVIIYGDRKDMEYNYHFMSAEEGSYPDLPARVSYCEAALDDPEGFMTPELEETLKREKLPEAPLIFSLDRLKGPLIPGKKQRDMIGAVLESLLIIYDEMKETVGERCIEGDLFHIVQFYLEEDRFSIGEYTYLELGDPVLPFKVSRIGDLSITAKNRRDISIGIYAIPTLSEKQVSYLTIIYDQKTELIVGYDLATESEMSGIGFRIVKILEKHDLKPSSLTFNNDFTEETLCELFDVYNLEYDPIIGDDELDNIYRAMVNGFEDIQENNLIH